jgi:hypothetical protein
MELAECGAFRDDATVLNNLFVYEHTGKKGVASKLMTAAVDCTSSLGAVRVRCQPQQPTKEPKALSNRWLAAR